MTHQDQYLAVALSALTILILGCWNPSGLQSRTNGAPTGYPNYMWLALFAFLVGAAFLLLRDRKGAFDNF